MTTKRLLILFAVLVAGLGSVFFLPKELLAQPTGIDLVLPQSIGEWWGKDGLISDKERQTLGAETQFARKSYTNFEGDELHVTIVLAGHDMNTGIHRPERCLPAQGWTIADSRSVVIPVPNGTLSTTRLYDTRVLKDNSGQPMPIFNLNYYWFVGYTDTTASHYSRTRIDILDRLLRGYNQRWAYVTVSATITKGLTKFGRSEGETDELIKAFIQKLVPATHKPSVELS